MRFSLATIPLKSIDLNDRTYKISTDRTPDELCDSIENVGLLTPFLLKHRSDRYSVISGFRRVAACLQLGWTEAPAQIADPQVNDLECLQAAIADHALHRPLNPIEQSVALSKLSAYYTNDIELSRISKKLGMPVASALIPKFKQLNRFPISVQEGVLSGAFSLTIALELGSLDEPSAEALSRLFNALMPSLSHQKQILTLVREISSITGLSIPSLLQESFVVNILCRSELSRSQRIDALLDALRRARYPKITAFEDQFCRLVGSLELGGGIQILPPKDFEGNRFSILLRFQTLPEIEAHLKRLEGAVKRPEFKAILKKDRADY